MSLINENYQLHQIDTETLLLTAILTLTNFRFIFSHASNILIKNSDMFSSIEQIDNQA
jgi:hypothetical protein